MNREETYRLLSILESNFSGNNFRQSPQERRNTAKLWVLELADIPYEEGSAAVNTMVRTRTEAYFPRIAELLELIAENRMSSLPSSEEAWQQVRHALRSSSYYSRREYQRLPGILRQAVGSPAELHYWAGRDEKDTEAFFRPRFLKTYSGLLAHYRKTAASDPAGLRALGSPAVEPEPAPAALPGSSEAPASPEFIRARREELHRSLEKTGEEKRRLLLEQLQELIDKSSE